MLLAKPPLQAGPLENAPIGRPQIIILVTAVLLAALDGSDALSVAFVGPALSRLWGLDKATLGVLLSSGLVGMAIGSLALSPVADKIGRRPAVLGSLALMTVGSGLSAVATAVPLLAFSRVLTGIGIGVMVVLTTLISAEFSNHRRRALSVAAIATIGFPLGGVIGGATAGVLLRTWGWRWVFLTGSMAGAALCALVALTLPESPSFLLARRPAGVLARLNEVLRKLGQPELLELPEQSGSERPAYRDLLAPEWRSTTLRLTAVNLLLAVAAYYLLNWLPQLVADAGFPVATGSFVSAASGLVGLAGGVILGALAARWPAARLAATTAVGMALALSGIGLIPPVLALFLVAAGAFAFCVSATTGVFYGILASSFPPLMRASGMGLVMGVGRVASAVAPALAGWMFSQGLSRATVSLMFAVTPLLAAGLIAGFRPAHASPALA